MSVLAIMLGVLAVAVAVVAVWLGRRPASTVSAQPDVTLRVELERLKVSAEMLAVQRDEERSRASALEGERDAARAQGAGLNTELAAMAARVRELDRRDQERLALLRHGRRLAAV